MIRQNVRPDQAVAIANAIRSGKKLHGAAAKQRSARIVSDAAGVGLDATFDVIIPATVALAKGEVSSQVAIDAAKNTTLLVGKKVVGGAVGEAAAGFAQREIRETINSQTASFLANALQPAVFRPCVEEHATKALAKACVKSHAHKAIHGAAAMNRVAKVAGSVAGGVALSAVISVGCDVYKLANGDPNMSSEKMVENLAKESFKSVLTSTTTLVGAAACPIVGGLIGGAVGMGIGWLICDA